MTAFSTRWTIRVTLLFLPGLLACPPPSVSLDAGRYLEVQTPYRDVLLPVALGRNRTARVQRLGPDGGTVFADVGEGPQTVTLRTSTELWTISNVEGEVARFLDPRPSGSSSWGAGVTPAVSGRVSGFSPGHRVAVELVLNGTVTAASDAAVDGTYSLPALPLAPTVPTGGFVIASEWSGAVLVSLGVARMAPADGLAARTVDVIIDAPLTRGLEPVLSNVIPGTASVNYRLTLLLEGWSYWPGGIFTLPFVGSRMTLQVPESAGAIGTQLEIWTGDQRYVNPQLATHRGELPVGLLSPPVITSPLGTEASPTGIDGPLRVAFDSPEATRASITLESLTVGRPLRWVIQLGAERSFQTFALPPELSEPDGLPPSAVVSATVRVKHEDGTVRLEAQATGFARTAELVCEQVLPPWVLGDWAIVAGLGLGAGDDGAGFLVDDHRLTVRACTFDLSVRGGDITEDAWGLLRPTGEPDRVLLRSQSPSGRFGFGEDVQVTRRVELLRGLPTATTSGPFEGLVLVRRPHVVAAPIGPTLAGTWVGRTVTRDYFATAGSAAGALLEAGSAEPADDLTTANGRTVAQIDAEAHYREVRALQGGVEIYREGTVATWSGAGGDLRFQNGPGICSDEHGIAALKLAANGELEVETSRQIYDRGDLDGDGQRSDWIWARTRVTFTRR